MPPSLRSLLPAFALSVIAIGAAGSVSPVLPQAAVERATAPEAVIDEALLHRPPLRLPAATPTLGDRAAAIALRAVGTPYRWGGSSPGSGFDCSGLIHWAYGHLGIELPHSSYALYDRGRRVPRTRIRPGDLLFFSGLGHMGLYVGRGRMVHAPQTGGTVEVVKLGGPYYGGELVGARRLARS
jgi:cell wall-associated NlpC family hydrolase